VPSFPQVSPLKHFVHLSSLPYVPYAPRISFFLIWSPEWYLVSSTDHHAPPYVVLWIPLLPCPITPKYLPGHPIFKHPQPTSLPQCERPSFTPTKNKRQMAETCCIKTFNNWTTEFWSTVFVLFHYMNVTTYCIENSLKKGKKLGHFSGFTLSCCQSTALTKNIDGGSMSIEYWVDY
jgi:hypothetical protein